jgi:hypothetical protein
VTDVNRGAALFASATIAFALAAACEGGGSSGGATVGGAPTSGPSSAEPGAAPSVKARFIEDNVVREDGAEWNGQPIDIQIEGVGLAQNGGVRITAAATTTRVRATGRLLAIASADEPANADASLTEAKDTFGVTNSPEKIAVVCGHGGTHGSSRAAESGCELVEIAVPAGSAERPLSITLSSGNGEVAIELAPATLANLAVSAGGGGITAAIPGTKGGNVALVAERSGDVTVTLPPSWAADEIVVEADADRIENAFSDAKIGAGAGGRGARGAGLASLRLTSRPFAGASGIVRLK